MNAMSKIGLLLILFLPVLVIAQPDQVGEQIYEFVTVEQKPVLITDAQPVYPQSAIDAGIEGTVVVTIVIGPNGNVTRAEIFRSVAGLDAAALAAARQKVYTAGLVGGNPVSTQMNVPIEFILPQPDVSAGDTGPVTSSAGSDVVDLTADAVIIKAEPDRPRVNIISDRIKPEFDNINLEKSFRAELLGETERLIIVRRNSDDKVETIDINQVVNRSR
jgi:TonB family protein